MPPTPEKQLHMETEPVELSIDPSTAERNPSPTNGKSTLGKTSGVTPVHPIPLLDTTDPMVEKRQSREQLYASKNCKESKREEGHSINGCPDPLKSPPTKKCRTYSAHRSSVGTKQLSRTTFIERKDVFPSGTHTLVFQYAIYMDARMADRSNGRFSRHQSYLVGEILKYSHCPVVKVQAFYFSLRMVGATGSQFTQVIKPEIMKTAKLGERMSFGPTSIPPQQDKLIFVGVILLKDASNTHHGHHLQYLRKEVLPDDTPYI